MSRSGQPAVGQRVVINPALPETPQLAPVGPGLGRVFYVDDASGDDASDGLSPATAWRSIERVNGASIQPGDSILFKRGGLWQGSKFEVPAGGAEGRPVTIGAYGSGEMPVISVAGTDKDTALLVAGKDYVTIQQIDVRGGFASIGVYGSDHMIIEDCRAGADASVGIWIGEKEWPPIKEASDHGIIRRCVIDSNYAPGKEHPEDGIHMRNGANHWLVYENELYGWGHTAISLWQYAEHRTVSFNRFFQNYITAERAPYGRAFEIKGGEGGAQYNEFYLNIVQRTSVRNQIGSDHNRVYYNIVDTVANSSYVSWATGQAFDVGQGSTGEDDATHHNQVQNNVMWDCDEPGIVLRSVQQEWAMYDNEITNNIIINCGSNSQEHPGSFKLWVDDKPAFRNNRFIGNLLIQPGTDVVLYRGQAMPAAAFNARSGTAGDSIAFNRQVDPDAAGPEVQAVIAGYKSVCTPQSVVELARDPEGRLFPICVPGQ